MPRALITGGSSGIGLAIAREFLTHGYDLVIISKSIEEIAAATPILHQDFPNRIIEAWAKDLSQSNAADELHDEIHTMGLQIDVLVNNAGFGTFGYFPDTNQQAELAMIDLNVRALYRLTKLFLMDMVHRNQGYIINISSLSAFFPSPYLSAYAATKAFVLHLGKAVHYELKQQGSAVGISTICPTPVRTAFQQNARMENSTLFDHWTVTTPEKVAKTAFNAMQSRKDYIIPDWKFHYLNKLVSRLPSKIKLFLAQDSLVGSDPKRGRK
jgi:short-subunit dehydrogenase